ncbi:hypothetical protein AJOOGB_AJOOGB_13620, partial [Dysosmobacter welbionis]
PLLQSYNLHLRRQPKSVYRENALFIYQMTADRMPWLHLPHHRVFFCAPLAFVGAAGVKTAARRHIDRGRNFPHALHCLWFDGLVLLRNYRDRGQQHLCIGVQRISIE